MRSTDDNGFTLIELLATVAIVGIISVPLIGLFTSAFGSSAHGRILTDTVNVCRGVMDEVRASIDSAGKLPDDSSLPTNDNKEVSYNSESHGCSHDIYVCYKLKGLYKVAVTTTRGEEVVTLTTLVWKED